MKMPARFAKALVCVAIASNALTANAQTEDESKNLPNFLLPEFTRCTIKFKSGDSKTAVINYNIVEEQMLFKQGDAAFMVLDNPELIDTLAVGERLFVPVKKGFYEVLTNGKIALYRQHKSTMEPVGAQSGYGATSQSANASMPNQLRGAIGITSLRIPDGYQLKEDDAYWVSKDGSMERFVNKRQFLKIFKDKEKEVTKFFDNNSISFSSVSDVKKLCNFCSELYK